MSGVLTVGAERDPQPDTNKITVKMETALDGCSLFMCLLLTSRQIVTCSGVRRLELPQGSRPGWG
jgi:hypothetical protein